MICPCKDCTDRAPTCHANCEKYKEWIDHRNELKKEAESKMTRERNWNEHQRQFTIWYFKNRRKNEH